MNPPEEAVPHENVRFPRLRVFDPRPIRCAVARSQVRPGTGEKVVMNVDDWHASLAWMNRAAMLTFAPALVRVELCKKRRQILHDALQLHFRAIDQLVAVRAVPFEGIQRALRAGYFNHHPDGFSRPLR